MASTILITGSTAGIGLAAAERLADLGERVILHGRDPERLSAAQERLRSRGADAAGVVADLARFPDVDSLASWINQEAPGLDVLINNAGVFEVPDARTDEGLDIRFMVNTIAPYVLTRAVLASTPTLARVINVASAGQEPVDLEALAGHTRIRDAKLAYRQSKLALIMWTRHLAEELAGAGPALCALNPGSLLATRMVHEAFGVPGKDIQIGVDAIVRSALDDAFATAGGAYYDNDAHRFAAPHPDALDPIKVAAVTRQVQAIARQRGPC